MYGYPGYKFNPEGSLTRAEFAAIVDRIFIFKNEETPKCDFVDIKGHWAEKEIATLAANGAVVGVDKYHFNPNAPLKRAEALLLLRNILYTAKYSNNFSGFGIEGHYAKDELAQMMNSGIYENIPASFDFEAPIPREEMVHIVNNILYKTDASILKTEGLLVSKGIYSDLLTDKLNPYYYDCVISLDRSYLEEIK